MLYTTFMQHILQQQPVENASEQPLRIPPSYKLPTRDETEFATQLSFLVRRDNHGILDDNGQSPQIFFGKSHGNLSPGRPCFFIGSAGFEEVNKMVNRIRQRTRQNVPSCCYCI